ncbi:hypothetical protein GCM10023163_07990 [Aestuariibaculum suncheonense]
MVSLVNKGELCIIIFIFWWGKLVIISEFDGYFNKELRRYKCKVEKGIKYLKDKVPFEI